MDRLNFNHLYYFYIVAKLGSIKEASEKLHVTQPTISDQLKLLEEYFDCRLFERKHRGLTITKQGELALEYAEKLFDMGNELTSRLRHNIKLPKTSIDIGITNYMAHYFLYDTIMPLFSQNTVSINCREDERHLLLAELEEDNIDLMFTLNKEAISPKLQAYRVGVNKTFVIAHKKYRKYKKNFPESLNQIPFFNYTSEAFMKTEIELFFSTNAISPRVIGESDDFDLFQTVTEKGLAFTIVPEVAKNRICNNPEVIVLGEIKDFQTTVYGIIQKSYKGLGYQLLKNKLEEI